MKHFSQAQWTKWDVWTLPFERKNHLQTEISSITEKQTREDNMFFFLLKHFFYYLLHSAVLQRNGTEAINTISSQY
jgi:hypothetical protein